MANGPNQPNDPWNKRKPEGPPDLDEVVRQFQNKMRKLFAKTTQPSENGGNNAAEPKASKTGLVISSVIAVLVLLWVVSGIFIVAPAEQGVILRFGKYVRTVGPGPHWIPQLIESDYVVNVQQIYNFAYQSEMLTKDENIVSVALAVQYRAANLRDYLFNVVDPVESLKQATASALRQVIGDTTLDDILTTGRTKVRQSVSQLLQQILAQYQTGIEVTDVTLQPAKPPEQVTEAFDDAIKAREDEQRYVNQAQAYTRKVVPIAQGQAARIVQAAQAYQQQVVLDAKANTASFLALLPEFKQAPQIMRERLYLDTVESVLRHSTKVLVDAQAGQNLIYLPLDKLLQESGKTQKKDDDSQNDFNQSTSQKMASATALSSTTDTMQVPPPYADDHYSTGGLY